VVLSLALALPFVVVTRSFRREATVAENVLRQALSGN